MDEAEARARRFTDDEARKRLGADDADFRVKIDEAQAKVDRLKAERADVHVGADIGELDVKIAAAIAELELLKEAERSAGDAGKGMGRDVKSGMDDAASSGNNLQGVLSNLKGGGGFGGLITAAIAFAPAAVTALGTVAIGTMGLVSALGAAGLGFGALGILASPILSSIHTDMTKITPLFQAWKEAQPGPQQVAAWNNLEAAIRKLPPGEREVVQGIIDVKAQLQGLSAAVRPELLAAFGSALTLLHNVLPTLVAPAQMAARALNSLFVDMNAHLGGWQHFVSVMTAQVEPAITGFGVAFGKFMVGIGRLLMAFAPLAQRMEGDLINLANRFEQWAGRLDTPAGLKRMVDYLNKNGPQLHQMLDTLWQDLKLLAQILSQIGPGELQGINAILTAIGKIAAIPGLGPILVELGIFATVMAKIGLLKPVVNILDGIGGALLRLFGYSGAARSLSGALGELASKLAAMASPVILGGLEALGGAVSTALGAVFSVPGAIIAGIVAEAAVIVLAFSDSFRKHLISDLPKGVQDGINHAAGVIKNIITVGFGGIPGLLIRMFVDPHFRNAVGNFFSTTIPNAISSAAGAVGRAIERYGAAIGRFFANIGTTALRFLARLPGDLLRIATQAGEFLLHGFMTALPKVAAFFAELPLKILSFLVTLPIKLLDLGIRALDALVQGINAAAPAVWNFFSSLPGRVIGFIEHLVGDLLSFGIRALGSMASGIASGAVAVWNFFTSLPGRVLGFLERLPGDLLSLGSRALSSMASGATSGASGVWSFISSIPGRILGLLGNLGSLLLNAGSELVHGLATGIEHGITGFLSSAIGHLKSLVGDAGKLLGHVFGSPSKTAAQWGLWIVQGLAQGLSNAIPELRAVMGMIASVVGGIGGPGALGGIGIGSAPSASNVTLAPQLIVQGNMDRATVAPVMTGMSAMLSGVAAEMRARGVHISRIPGAQ